MAIAVVTTNTMMNRLILESIDGEMDEDLSVWPRSLAAIDGDGTDTTLVFIVMCMGRPFMSCLSSVA